MNSTTDQPLVVTSVQTPIHKVDASMFGAIGINNYGYHYFEEHTELLGLTDIRWPGGTVSEGGYVIDGRIRLDAGEISLSTLTGDRSAFAFDLTHPELISPLALSYDEENHLARDDVGTFTQAIQLAVSRDVDLALIIPVQRYFNLVDFTDEEIRAQAIEIARADIAVFAERLKAGAWNDGNYPASFTFDIGNEAYANPIEYALIAKAIINELNAQLDGSGINYHIGFQMGRGSYEFMNLVEAGYFDPFFDGSGDPIAELQDLGFVPSADLPYDVRQTAIDQMMASLLGEEIIHIDVLRQHILSFNSNTLANPDSPLNERQKIFDFWADHFESYGIDFEDIIKSVSAWSTNSGDGGSLPYELSAAANTVELFAHFMNIGIDRASIWGIVGAFRYSDNMATTTVTDRLSDFLSPQAAILQLLTANIIDSSYLGEYQSASGDYVRYTYENASSYTIFFVAGKIDGETLIVDADLGLFSDLASVGVVNLDIANGESHGAAQLTETNLIVTDGKVSLTFDQSHEIVVVTLNKGESNLFGLFEAAEAVAGEELDYPGPLTPIIGTDASEVLSGGNKSDIIYGGAGADTLDGGGGRVDVRSGSMNPGDFDLLGSGNGDFLFGGDGDDTLRGYAGNDLLSGDGGNDDLWGGSGFDTFVFTEGHDTVHDFFSGVDRIAIDTAFLDGLPIEVWLNNAAQKTEAGLLLTAASGDTLLLKGIIDPTDILDDIAVVEASDYFEFA